MKKILFGLFLILQSIAYSGAAERMFSSASVRNEAEKIVESGGARYFMISTEYLGTRVSEKEARCILGLAKILLKITDVKDYDKKTRVGIFLAREALGTISATCENEDCLQVSIFDPVKKQCSYPSQKDLQLGILATQKNYKEPIDLKGNAKADLREDKEETKALEMLVNEAK